MHWPLLLCVPLTIPASGLGGAPHSCTAAEARFSTTSVDGGIRIPTQAPGMILQGVHARRECSLTPLVSDFQLGTDRQGSAIGRAWDNRH